MKSFSKESKDKIVLDLKQVSNNWGSLLSKYDEEISKNHQEIEKLSQTLDSLKDNKSISGSISKEIEDRESNIKKIRSSKKDLIDYLDIKKSQIGKLVSRSKIQEDNKKEIMETLKWNIENMKSELQKLKENYDAMVPFPKIQENIQIEMKKLSDDIVVKEKELKRQETSELISKTLLEKVEAMWWKELLEKDFALNKYELKNIDGYRNVFVDEKWDNIERIENLWLDINRHGPYFVRKLDDRFIDIVSNDSHYIYDLKNMKILWQVDHNVNVFENDWNKYVGLRDVNTFAADNEYSIFDLKTWEKIFDKKIKGNPWWIKKMWDKNVIYTRTYFGNKTRIHFYAKENWDEIWSKTGYIGDRIVFDLDELSQNPISDTDKRDFIKKVFGVGNVFFIDNWYGVDSISVLDSNTLEKIGDFATKSDAVQMEDGSMVALKYMENSNDWIIFDLKEQKDLSSDFCNTRYSIKNYDNYCVVTKVDWNNLILNKKTKKVVDCMWKVSSDIISGTSFVLVSSNKWWHNFQRLVNVDKSNVLSLVDKTNYSLQDVYVFRSDKISSNIIIQLKNKSGDLVYSYVNIVDDLDENGDLKINKTYSKIDKKWSGYDLSNWLFSKIKINWYGNKI
jgi:hypothetical protein